LATVPLRLAADLWTLLPDGLDEPFTTLDLADRLNRPVAFAQRVAYCLRLSGAAEQVGKRGNRLIYCKVRTEEQTQTQTKAQGKGKGKTKVAAMSRSKPGIARAREAADGCA
jgi:hypothetical protein